MRTHRTVVLLAASLLGLPAVLAAQSLLPVPQVQRTEAAPALVKGDTGAARTGGPAPQASGVKWWSSVIRSERDAQKFWDEQQLTLLPGTSLAIGSGHGAVFTEMAAVLSGAWRFSAGTTLAVASGDSASARALSGFQSFLAGGGNVSLQAARPLFARGGSSDAELVFLVPRGWVNVPALSDAENVQDFGGELALEAQYHRLQTSDRKAFFILHVRGGVVAGSESFYGTIGRSHARPFAYGAPTVSFVVEQKVKLGVAGFVGPSDLPRGKLRFTVTLLNEKAPQSPAPDTTSTTTAQTPPPNPGR